MNRAAKFIRGVGVAGLALAALGWWLNRQGFYAGWLAAFTLLLGWSLGSVALLLIHSLTGGRWGDALRPALRIGASTVALLLPACIPLVLGLAWLYPWARPGAPGSAYANLPFFAVRGAIYLVVWIVLAVAVLRVGTLARIAPLGLLLLAFTTTFAAIDTTMSLDAHFVSTIYGMLAASGMALLALSMAVLLTAAGAAPDVRADFGKLLLALVVLWIYLDFMQLLIIWQSDLATEAPWYLERSRGAWGALRLLIVLGHFLAPFALMLSPRLQRSRRVLLGVAVLLVASEVLRSWWTVLPSLGLPVGWIDLACIAGLGGAAIWFALWAARWPIVAEARHG